jgi:ATP-binding cassette, subfamily C, bacterial
MTTVFALLRTYPARSAIMLVALIVAGAAEGLSLTALLPLLSVAAGESVDGNLNEFVVGLLARARLEPTVGAILIVIVCGITLKSSLLLVANSQVGYTVARIATDFRVALIDALLASKWQYFVRQRTGALANSVATEAYRAAIGFEYGARFLSLALQVVVYAGIALMVSWQATTVSLAFGALFTLALHSLLRVARHAGTKQTQLMRELLSYLTDVLSSVKPLKAMARDRAADAILKSQTGDLEDATRRDVMSRETLRALQEPILASLAALGLYFALTIWSLRLSEVMVLVFILVRLLGLVNKMQRTYQRVVVQESAYWALRQTAEQALASSEHAGGTKIPTIDHSIRLRDVAFAYGDHRIFEDLQLEIPARNLIVIAAPSGTGKSTLLDLLCGLLKPQHGSILIDEVPLDEIDLRAWRRMIGYVPQETVLLHDSILNNVIIGEPDLTDADAARALKQAGMWDFIERLPDGLDTVVGERGGQISGGQRQRIAVARALAHQPQILILDEPTSSLDHETERLICETLRALAKELTVVAASHQHSLIEAADRVVSLEDGHATLLSSRSHDSVSA